MIAKRIALALIIAAFVAIPMSSVNVKATNDKSLTGSWNGTVSTPFFSFKFLMTANQDGGLLVSQAPLGPGAPPNGHTVYTLGHGEWDKTRSGEFSFTFVALIHDENATFLGTAKVNGTIHVDGTLEAFTGTAHACDLDPAGTPFFCFDAELQAARIRVGS